MSISFSKKVATGGPQPPRVLSERKALGTGQELLKLLGAATVGEKESKNIKGNPPPHPLPSLLMALHSWGHRDARAHRLRRADRRAIAGCAGRGPGRRRQGLGPGETPLACPPRGLRARAPRGSGHEQGRALRGSAGAGGRQASWVPQPG